MLDLPTPEGWTAELIRVGFLDTKMDYQSPIQVVTGPGLEQPTCITSFIAMLFDLADADPSMADSASQLLGYVHIDTSTSPSLGFRLRVVCHSYKLHPH